MKTSLSIVYLFLILFFASCEDKESSSKNKSETTSENDISTTKPSNLDSLKAKYSEKKVVEQNTEEADDRFPIPQEQLIPFLTQYGKENPENRVRIITSFGDIEVMLYRDTPLHRANFIMLVKKGYFDNTFFHRVAPGFVIQG